MVLIKHELNEKKVLNENRVNPNKWNEFTCGDWNIDYNTQLLKRVDKVRCLFCDCNFICSFRRK